MLLVALPEQRHHDRGREESAGYCPGSSKGNASDSLGPKTYKSAKRIIHIAETPGQKYHDGMYHERATESPCYDEEHSKE